MNFPFRAVLALLIFFYSPIFSLKSFHSTEEFSIENNNWKVFQTDNISLTKINQTEFFQLNENKEESQEKLDLYLDFETPLKELSHYKIITANYEQNKYQNFNGQYSGKFYFQDHYISLLPLPSSVFFPGKISGSFTIEFWAYFYKNYDHQYMIKYMGNNLSDDQDKNSYGFAVYTRNNKIVYQFNNFFWSPKKETISMEIEEEENIKLEQWEHHALTFNILNGKLSAFKNGVEQEVKWATVDGKTLSPILTPSIKEELSTPFLIGQNGIFALDNFKVLKDVKEKFYIKKYKNQESVLVTDIYHFSENLSELKKISFSFKTPEYSFLKLAYRVSGQYFRPDDKQVKWVYIQNNIDHFPEDFSWGKYIQFKIQAYPYEDMSEPLVINGIKLYHSADVAPYPPILINVTPLDGKVDIEWIPSPEDDIAGYEIYYGNRKEDYICRDAAEGKSPVFVPATDIGKITKKNFILSGLVNENPYFIALRSVDKNGHKSPFSKEIYVRPSTIYNEKKYSVDR
jgi:hypothetical protein